MATLSPEQKQTLKTWYLANANTLSDEQAAALLNSTASPDFLVYRTAVPVAEVMLNGFDWTQVDNLSVGKARVWEWLTRANPANTFDPSKANIRAGINECWKGTAAMLAVRAAVYAHCTSLATVGEKLFATGAGTAPNQDGDGPGTRAVVGPFTAQNVIDALSLT